MDVMIEKEHENKLLHRKEMSFSVKDVNVTPSREEIAKKIAALKNADENLVVIENISQLFGRHSVKGNARIYADKKMLEKIESDFLLKRGKKKTGAEEKPAEAKPAEKEKGKE